jgi:transcriptional regulator of acetoin/glycerol metabolism
MSSESTVPLGFRPGVPIREVNLSALVGAETRTARGETLSVGSAEGNDLVLEDDRVSRYHLEIRCEGDKVLVRDLGSTNGTFIGAIEVRSAEVRVPAGTPLRVGRSTVTVEPGEVRELAAPLDPEMGILGRSAALRRVLARAKSAASRDVTVLVQGESGTGKELLARAMHELSPRRAGPFVTVDCGSISPQLVASELFGHERGAFTGADRKHTGAFERASGGTLFLDEIGELPKDVQPVLLGALERRRIRRVGGSQDIPVDLRIVAATHRDLRAGWICSIAWESLRWLCLLCASGRRTSQS